MANSYEKAKRIFDTWNQNTNSWSSFLEATKEIDCVKSQVISLYKKGLASDQVKHIDTRLSGLKGSLSSIGVLKSNLSVDSREVVLDQFDPTIPEKLYQAANWVWSKKKQDAVNIMDNCSRSIDA
jgi:hypothetical protein